MRPGAEGDRARAVIRAPNHLGDLVLSLPALEAAAERWSSPPLVQVVEELVPVLRLSGLDLEPLPLAGRHRVVRAARALRRRRPDVGVLLTPSFSAAMIFFLAGIRARRGTDTDARGWLLTDPVDRRPLLRGHRVREYLRLVDEEGGGPRGAGGRRDAGGAGAPRPRLHHLRPARSAWRGLARRHELNAGRSEPVVGLVPGGTSPARRWPARRYAELADRLASRGCRVRVFGGPSEGPITGRVAGGIAGAEDLGGRTGLLELAGGLESCDLVVGNDTGSVHLAAAADRPVVVVWGSGDPVQTRPLAPSLCVVGRFGLPCHPCLESECPRRGPGYRAERARRECLELIPVDEVEAAAGAALDDRASGPSAPDGKRGGRDA